MDVQSDVLFLFPGNGKLQFDVNFIYLNGNQRWRFFDFGAYKRLDRIIREGNYDLVQANASDTLKYSVFSKLLFHWKVPLVYRNAAKMGDFLIGAFHRAFMKFLLKNCDLVISVSESCRRDVLRIIDPNPMRTITITIGTDTAAYIPTVKLEAHIPKESPIFINVGSFVPEKNHLFLLRVFKEFIQHYGKGTLWLVGDGKLKRRIKHEINLLNLNHCIHLFGYLESVMPVLNRADVMVMPSLIEGLPGVILEGMSCGKPVIASSAGGISEIIKNGVTGFCLPEFTTGEYVLAMEKLANDINLRKRISNNGRAIVNKNFDNSVIAARFYEAYQQLIYD